MVKSSVITGDSIQVQVSIVFDINDPVITNTWVNYIDAVAPTSTVNMLPPFIDSTTIQLSWSGIDDPNGVGVQSYSLYVSENGGPFFLHEDEIPFANYEYYGTEGNSYQFFVLARDYVRNLEPLKSVGEAFVTITDRHELNLNVLLEGAYSSGGMMSALHTIPNNQPYNAAPWNYIGQESIATIPENAIDWVLISIRTDETKASALDTLAALLLDGGQVVSATGNSLSAELIGTYDSLYVVIDHRNHLPVMTNGAIGRTNGVFTVNFTQDVSTIFGNSIGVTASNDGFIHLVSGDFDGNGQVQNSDLQSYLVPNIGKGANFEF